MRRKLLILAIIVTIGLFMLSFSGARPTNLGVTNGKLLPLPESPNAVSTQTDDTSRKMEPIKYSGSVQSVMEQIKLTVLDMPRSAIVISNDDYVHVEFRSFIFRFVDDVEFFIDHQEKLIHFRSASRVGHSDLGVNRKRMEQIRKSLDGRLQETAGN